MTPEAPAFATRAMIIADYAAVLALWQSADGVEVAEGDARHEVERCLLRNPGLSRIAGIGGELVGAVLCGHDGRRGLIYHLAVATAHRGRGIGRQLVRECIAGLQANALSRVVLLVDGDNSAGRSFWIGQGFEVIDALPLGRDLP